MKVTTPIEYNVALKLLPIKMEKGDNIDPLVSQIEKYESDHWTNEDEITYAQIQENQEAREIIETLITSREA